MHRTISVDKRLAAHILLDPELKGRFDIEGIHFATTAGFLSNFLDIYFKNLSKSIPKKMQQLCVAISNMVELEKRINRLEKEADLNSFINTLSKDVHQLKTGDYLLLPGGWKGTATRNTAEQERMISPGHAMVYQLTKMDNDDIQFTIYNSGSGLEYHECMTSPQNERYFPVRSHLIDIKHSKSLEFKGLLKRLLMPMIKGEVDALLLYQSIDKSLIFLEARPTKVSDHIPEELTTAGQVSGTCAQRVLQQMLKILFGNLREYQHFCIHLKMHTLRAFIKNLTDHSGETSETDRELIHLSIKHIAKLLRASKWAESSEIKKYLQELSTLSKQYPQEKKSRVQPPSSNYRAATGKTLFIEAKFEEAWQVCRAKKDKGFGTKETHPYVPLIDLDLENELFPQFDALINFCKDCDSRGDSWFSRNRKTEQLEHALISLPIPLNFTSTLPAYSSITLSKEQIEKMLGYLEQFQAIYLQATVDTSLIRVKIIHSLLISLRDFFHFKSLSLDAKPGHAHSKSLRDLFLSQEHNPFFATGNPLFDRQFSQIIALYKESKPVDSLYKYYESLFTSEELNLLHDIFHHYYRKTLDPRVFSTLSKKNLQIPYALFDLFNGAPNLWDNIKHYLPNTGKDFTELTLLKENLLAKFSRQIKLEQFIYNGCKCFLDHNYSDYKPPRLCCVNDWNEEVLIQLIESTWGKIRYYRDRFDYKNESTELLALEEGNPKQWGTKLSNIIRSTKNNTIPKWTSNRIQVSAGQLVLPTGTEVYLPPPSLEQTIYLRELLHLRTVPEHQIQLTLDYFKLAIKGLSDKNAQCYVEANLFERDRLLILLTQDLSGFLTQFDGFICRGLQFFLSDLALATQHSLFFIHLRFCLNHYLVKVAPDVARSRLQDDLHDLSRLLALPHEAALLHTIHLYRFLTTMRLHELNLSKQNAWLPEVFHSLFALDLSDNPHFKINTYVETQLDRDCYHIKGWFQSVPEEALKQFLLDTLSKMDLVREGANLKGKYPFYTLTHDNEAQCYDIDLETMSIYRDQRALSRVPNSLRNQPFFNAFGLENELLCFVAPNTSEVEFITPTQQISIVLELNQWLLKKKWHTSLGGSQNYWLCPLNESQRRALKLDALKQYTIEHKLPAVFNDPRNTLWVNFENQSRMLVRDQRPLYHSNAEGAMEQLDAQGQPSGYILSSCQGNFITSLTQFEDLDYIITQRKDEDWRFILPRFKIILNSAGTPTLHSSDGYNLSHAASPLPSRVACLLLEKNGEEKLLVRVQPMEELKKVKLVQGDYSPLYHKTSNTKHAIWEYDSEKSAITYSLRDGNPISDTPADALYLCYLYLCNHQPDKAWEVLEGIDGLECAMRELLFLEWIVQKIPLRSYPALLACQLKALALLTDCLAEDRKPPLPNQIPATKPQEEIQTFYKSLPKKIGELLTTFQIMERSLSQPFFLSNRERRSLLNTWQRLRLDKPELITIDNTFNIRGALGYQYQRLDLELLLKEQAHLNTLKQSLHDKKLPHALEKRLTQRQQELNRVLTREGKILKRCSQLELVTIYLKSTKELRYPDLELTSNESGMSQAKFHSELSESEFLKLVPVAVLVALEPKEQSIQFQELNAFCIHYIRISNHPSSLMEDSIYEAVCTTLYLLLHAPCSIKQRIKNEINKKSYRFYHFADLNQVLQDVTPPLIQMYQVKNEFRAIGEEENELMIADCEKEFAKTQVRKLILSPVTPVHTVSAFRQNLALTLNEFKVFTNEYQQAEQEYNEAFERLLQASSTAFPSIQVHHQAEQAAGLLKFTLAHKQKTAAERFISEALRKQIQDASENALPGFIQACETAWSKAVEGANKPPSHTPTALQRDLEQLAGLRHERLANKDLLRLYVQEDLCAWMEETRLSEQECRTLHQLTHEAVRQELETDHLRRVIDRLAQIKPGEEHGIATTLMSEAPEEALEDPTLMLFQYQEDILLRKQQCLALKNLLNTAVDDPFKFHESVEKVIMGGGKSKVLLPLLAQKKAQGHNLLFIEVPRALLKTNHADLNHTSRQLFGQRARCFEFNRDSNCSPERLQELYKQFAASMTDKSYWVTTGEAMQSLELKYLELLLNGQPKENYKQCSDQLYWLEKTLSLIRECGDVLIDEMHHGLLLRKELNYSIGKAEAVDIVLRQHSIKLYRFIHHMSQRHYPEGELLRAEALRAGWTQSLKTLITDIVHEKLSPLNKLVDTLKRHYGDAAEEAVQAWLADEQEWDAISRLSPLEQDTLAFYKEQLSSLLPHTLMQKHSVVYGPGEEARSYDPLKQVIAVPYVANSQPSDRSDFGNILTKINYTIQSVLINGLNESLLEIMVEEWLRKAKLELEKNPSLISIQNTPTGKGLQATGIQLQSIDSKNKKQIEMLLEKVRFNTDLLFSTLEQKILEQITTEPNLLRSNALNHVDLYHSVQGVSGTPYNYSTFHQRMHFNRNTALGTDGYLAQTLKHKKTQIHALGFTNTNDFLPQLFATQSGKKTRAIIDVGAMFTGIANIDVAKALAAYWKQHDETIQFILYFNQDHILSALEIKTGHIILLNSSNPDEINQKLSATPEQRFTYYDQAHTVGTDLKQPSDSIGIVLIDPKTPIQSFLQGAMRMRGLEENQNIVIITPESLAFRSLDDLLALMIQNEQEQLSEENFQAAIAKLDNLVRNEALKKIIALPDRFENKINYINILKRYFVQESQGSLFEKYGHVASSSQTREVLEQHKKKLLKDYGACLKTFEPDTTPAQIAALDWAMQLTIADALPLCPLTIHSHTASIDQQTETQKQMQEEQQILQEQQKELFQQSEFQKKNPSLYRPWKEEYLSGYLNYDQDHEMTLALNDRLLADKTQNLPALFSTQLRASTNYAQTTTEHPEIMLDNFLKPIQEILFTRQEQGIRACLISNEEAEELDKLLQKPPFNEQDIWLSSTQHTVLAGRRPEGITQDKEYLGLIEQIRFFNGELLSLNQQKESFLWLNKETSRKLECYRQFIAPWRKNTSSELTILETKISCLSLAFAYLQEHRFAPQELLWNTLFPDAIENDLTVLVNLTNAFTQVNQHPLAEPALKLDDLCLQYALPLEAKAQLQTHLDIQAERKRFWERCAPKPDFEKISEDRISFCLTLMRVLYKETPSPLSITAEHCAWFFNHLKQLNQDEWNLLLKHNDIKTLLCFAPFPALRSLWEGAVDDFNQETENKFVATIPFDTLLSFMKQDDLDPNKKIRLLHHFDWHQCEQNQWSSLLDALPKKQAHKVMKAIARHVEHSNDKKESYRNLRKAISTRTKQAPLKRLLLIHPDSLASLINGMTGKDNTAKIKALNNIKTMLEDSKVTLSDALKSEFLLHTIQGICEYKRHTHNVLWQAQSVANYRQWLIKENALELFRARNQSIRMQDLQELASQTDNAKIGQLLLDWQKRSLIEDVLEPQDEMSEFDLYLARIEMLQNEFPEHKAELQTLISTLQKAQNANTEQGVITCRKAISRAKEKLEQEKGLWSLLKPILNGILSLLTHYKIYKGTLFTSEATQAWQDKNLDILPQKQEGDEPSM